MSALRGEFFKNHRFKPFMILGCCIIGACMFGYSIAKNVYWFYVIGSIKGIFQGIRTMTANIVLEMGYATDLHREALIATAVVLFVFILIINLSFSILKRRSE